MAKYIIVGGVAGGMSAAARLRRVSEKSEIIVFEKGEYVSYANCGLPYYLGGILPIETNFSSRPRNHLKEGLMLIFVRKVK